MPAAPVDRCCRILGVARQNYYKHKRSPTTPRQLRREWLTGLIREVHVASRGTYGYRRVHAELTLGMGIQVCPRTVSVLMTQAGIHGLPGPVQIKRLRGGVTADGLANREFHRLRPNELSVTDITQHPAARRFPPHLDIPSRTNKIHSQGVQFTWEDLTHILTLHQQRERFRRRAAEKHVHPHDALVGMLARGGQE